MAHPRYFVRETSNEQFAIVDSLTGDAAPVQYVFLKNAEEECRRVNIADSVAPKESCGARALQLAQLVDQISRLEDDRDAIAADYKSRLSALQADATLLAKDIIGHKLGETQ